MEEKDINRLLIQFDRLLKDANKKNINPKIEELNIEGLQPLIRLVARSRARYLEYVYELSKEYEDKEDYPTPEELQKLKTLRLRFEELTAGSQAFETSIQRGYLDLKLS